MYATNCSPALAIVDDLIWEQAKELPRARHIQTIPVKGKGTMEVVRFTGFAE